MQPELSCEQVGALMTFYLENKLSDKLSQYVKNHLDNCPQCAEKYRVLQTMVNKIVNIQRDTKENSTGINDSQFLTRQYEEFKLNLSAYIDNELNDEENMKIKKISISNPLARRDLEDMYTFKKLLHYSFDKTRNEMKNDFSKYIINQMQIEKPKNKIDPFYKIITFFVVIVSCILTGIIWMLYF